MTLNDIYISTERLFLRSISLSDAESMLRYRSNPKVYEYQNFKPKTIDDVNSFINDKVCKKPNIPDTWHQLSILNKESNELIGDIGIHFIDDMQVEIGYTLAIEHQVKGYATEAIYNLIDYLFNSLNKHRITASVDPRNTKSIALLERINMRKEAHFKKSYWFNGEWTDDVIFAILREEWTNKL